MKTSSLLLLVLALANTKAEAISPIDRPTEPASHGAHIFLGSPGGDTDRECDTLMDQLQAAGLDISSESHKYVITLPESIKQHLWDPSFRTHVLEEKPNDIAPPSVVAFREEMEQFAEPIAQFLQDKSVLLPDVSIFGYKEGGIAALKLAQIFSRYGYLYNDTREQVGAVATIGAPPIWDSIKDNVLTGMLPRTVISAFNPTDELSQAFSLRDGADHSLSAFEKNSTSVWNTRWIHGDAVFASLGHKSFYRLPQEASAILHEVEVPATFALLRGTTEDPLTFTEEQKAFTVGMLGHNVKGFQHQDLTQTVIGGWRVEENIPLIERRVFYTAAGLNDSNWDAGISKRSRPAFFLRRTDESVADFRVGRIAEFAQSGKRRIIGLEGDAPWLNVIVEGDLLIPYGDGFPHPIKVMDD